MGATGRKSLQTRTGACPLRILVIGAAGQLARSLIEQARTNTKIIATGRREIDLSLPAKVGAAVASQRPDAVINAAAYTSVDKAESDEALAWLINAEGPAALAETCDALKVPIIHVSTDYVFAGTKDGLYKEDDLPGPLGVYGRSKLEGERRVAAACPRHIIVRTAWVHSPFGNNFVKTMLRLAVTRPEIGVVVDQFGCPTYAPHLAQAILTIAETVVERDAPDDRWGIYHCTGGGSSTWHGLASEVFRSSRNFGGPTSTVRAIPTAEYPTPAPRPTNSRLDNSKLAKTFDIRLPDWRDGVEACVNRLLGPKASLSRA